MTLRLAWFPALVVLAMPMAVSAANKCTDADGRVTYQDGACPDRSRSEAMALPQAPDADARASAREQAILSAIARGVPATGMTRAQLDTAMATLPVSSTPSVAGGIRYDHLVFRRPDGRSWSVSLESGIVTAITLQGGSAPNAEARRPADCPTETWLRQAETHVTSITLSGVERRDLQRRIRDYRRNCVD